MSDGTPVTSSPITRHRKRWILPVALAGAAALIGTVGFLSGGVNALFTDSDPVGANSFTTGTLNLTASPASSAINYVNMVPGDTATQPLSVANGGSTPLRYAVRSTTTEDVLAAQLDLTVKSGVSSCTTTAGFNATGTVIFGPGDLGSVATANLVGSAAAGANPGDRTLAAGAGETLCFHVELPVGSSNSFQGLSTTATFQFVSEQTANNP